MQIDNEKLIYRKLKNGLLDETKKRDQGQKYDSGMDFR